MRRLLACVATGLEMVCIAWLCVIASPMILFSCGVYAVRHGIEVRWPDSGRARAVSFWFGLLAPVAMLVVMTVLLITVVQVRRSKRAMPNGSSDNGPPRPLVSGTPPSPCGPGG